MSNTIDNNHNENNTSTYTDIDDEKYNCSLIQAFDQYVLCYSIYHFFFFKKKKIIFKFQWINKPLFYYLAIGGQAINYYRYGERKNCKPKWENLKFCLQLKSKPIDIRKVNISCVRYFLA